jgi:hypothetical protein
VCVQKMPEKIRKLWDDKSTRSWIKTEYCQGFNYLPTNGVNHPELKAILLRHQAAEKARKTLREHVRNVVYQFSTAKQMRDAIPDLDRYIPEETQKAKMLPAITGLIDELTKAGFPKGRKS